MEVIETLLSSLFPRSCVRCGREGVLSCATCLAELPFSPPAATPNHVSAFAYGNPLVRDLLKAWKYEFDASGWYTLRDAATSILPVVRKLLDTEAVAIVPIPLSSRRLCERGFNQSMIIARWLGQELGLPVIDALERKHSSVHQAGLSTAARAELAVASPFILKSGSGFSISHFSSILLVDDVLTTGATLAAAKASLVKSSNVKVTSFTLAKS